MGIEVDFNNVRISAANDFNNIVRALNAHNENGKVEIDADYLERKIEALRSDLILICCSFLNAGEISGDEMRDISNEVSFEYFNAECEFCGESNPNKCGCYGS